MSDHEKPTAWIGLARFRITGNMCGPLPKRRMVELRPGDIVLRNAQRLYCTTGCKTKRTKGEAS
jgi:hypothetical protein